MVSVTMKMMMTLKNVADMHDEECAQGIISMLTLHNMLLMLMKMARRVNSGGRCVMRYSLSSLVIDCCIVRLLQCQALHQPLSRTLSFLFFFKYKKRGGGTFDSNVI